MLASCRQQAPGHLLPERNFAYSKQAQPSQLHINSSETIKRNNNVVAFSIFSNQEQHQWNSIIRNCSRSSSPKDSILVFLQALSDSVYTPNHLTFPILFKACRRLSAIEEGRQLHAQAIKRGFDKDVFVQRTLIRMYARCGECWDSWNVFVRCSEPDVVSQNDLISGYVGNGELGSARQLFDQMTQKNVVSWSIIIDGYAKNRQMEIAQEIFNEMPERNQFSWNSLMSGYLSCGYAEHAKLIFDRMPERGVVAWTVMISGYTQNCLFKEALELFQQMQNVGLEPNEVTLVSVLPAVAQLGALSQGRWIHAYMVRKGMEPAGVLGSALVDMYCKCGCIKEALDVFQKLERREVSAWNSIILGLANQGLGKDALHVFSRMRQDSSVIPNDVTFVGVLSACSHAGLAAEGRKIFNLLTNFYKVTPNIRHYGCMVDLLGRAGLLKEAKEVLDNMPIKPNSVIWKTLLNACRIHKDVELAEHISRSAIDSGPQDSGFYVLIANIFAEAGRWENVEKVRKEMNNLKVQKQAGCSWIEVGGVVHEFLMGGERFHSQSEEITSMVDEMGRLVMLKQNRIKASAVSANVDEKCNRHSEGHHSEKLAIAFGLINMSQGAVIRVLKNLRICNDCHSAIKLVSESYNREIIVRDASRFHHFRDGKCSCMDYW